VEVAPVSGVYALTGRSPSCSRAATLPSPSNQLVPRSACFRPCVVCACLLSVGPPRRRLFRALLPTVPTCTRAASAVQPISSARGVEVVGALHAVLLLHRQAADQADREAADTAADAARGGVLHIQSPANRAVTSLEDWRRRDAGQEQTGIECTGWTAMGWSVVVEFAGEAPAVPRWKRTASSFNERSAHALTSPSSGPANTNFTPAHRVICVARLETELLTFTHACVDPPLPPPLATMDPNAPQQAQPQYTQGEQPAPQYGQVPAQYPPQAAQSPQYPENAAAPPQYGNDPNAHTQPQYAQPPQQFASGPPQQQQYQAQPQYQGQPQYGSAPPQQQTYGGPGQVYAAPPEQQHAASPAQYGQPAHYQPPPQQYGQHGQQPQGQQMYGGTQQQFAPVVTTPTTTVLVVGGCAAGGGHSIVEDFTPCGICCGVCCFPIGLICCLTMKQQRCIKCNHHFN
jgi:hypothetical protein